MRKGNPVIQSELADMRKQFKEILYERPDLSKEEYLKKMGYDINSLTIYNSGDNSVHVVDVNSVINNEEEVVATEEIEAVLVWLFHFLKNT